jgi:TolB-like protein/Tfp pilus assembly protein PilF
MASLVEGFEYDIFISYRQKDNRYDGWVTAFVEHLKAELESTFKDEVSVYFDINPHDGLLETHDVDASLKEKLKCLVFIPVISQTYCDPKSFAWEHEFRAFAAQAASDRFGLKVTLHSGNVTSRILPVRIHELDPEDREMLESEIGGTLRSVDFIYREPGVNRPLTPGDDESRNLCGTKYRNQINKTANAVKEIISSLMSEHPAAQREKHAAKEPWEEPARAIKEAKRRTGRMQKRPALRLEIMLTLVVLAGLAYVIYRHYAKNPGTTDYREKSIAVLPIEYIGSGPENSWLGDALTDELISRLGKINGLDVRSRTSVMRYRTITRSISEIGREINANYIIEGSYQVNGDRLRINVKLISSRKDHRLWSDIYEGTWDDMATIQGEIAEQAASALKTVLTPEEKAMVEKNPTANTGAYLNYISANVMSGDALNYFLTGNRFVDSISFASAIRMYDRAIEDDPDFALAYARRSVARSWGLHAGQLDASNADKCRADAEKAFELESNLPDAQIALGFYNYYCTGDYQKAIFHFSTAREMEPANYQPPFYMAMVYRKMGDWKTSQDLIMKVISQEPQDALILINIGISFNYLHSYDTAIAFYRKATEVLPGWSGPYLNMTDSYILRDGNTARAREVLDTAIARTGERQQYLKVLFNIYDGRYGDALKELRLSSDDDFGSPGLKYLTAGWVYGLLNDKTMSDAYNDSALVFYKQMVIEYPENYYAYSCCGLAYASSGNATDAVIAGRTAVELAGSDMLTKSDMILNLAKIYIMNGDRDNAIRQVDYLLKNPSGFSINLLKIDPDLKKLQGSPGLKKLTSERKDILYNF